MVRPTQRTNAVKIVLAVIAGMFALLLGLIVLLLIGAETGPVELMIGMVCAMLPVPIYVSLLLWLDRYEAEPLWMLATAFFWGALIAVFIAIVFNTGIELMAAAAANSKDVGQNVAASRHHREPLGPLRRTGCRWPRLRVPGWNRKARCP